MSFASEVMSDVLKNVLVIILSFALVIIVLLLLGKVIMTYITPEIIADKFIDTLFG